MVFDDSDNTVQPHCLPFLPFLSFPSAGSVAFWQILTCYQREQNHQISTRLWLRTSPSSSRNFVIADLDLIQQQFYKLIRPHFVALLPVVDIQIVCWRTMILRLILPGGAHGTVRVLHSGSRPFSPWEEVSFQEHSFPISKEHSFPIGADHSYSKVFSFPLPL